MKLFLMIILPRFTLKRKLYSYFCGQTLKTVLQILISRLIFSKYLFEKSIHNILTFHYLYMSD